MHHIVNQLNRKFPLSASFPSNSKVSLLIGLFIFTFLMIFQPFGLKHIESNKIWIISGYGFITSVLNFIHLFFIQRLFKESNWTTWKQIIFYLWILTIITLVNFQYTKYYNPLLTLPVWNFLFYTFIIGVIPISFLLLYRQQKLYKQYWAESQQINQSITTHDDRTLFNTSYLEVQSSSQSAIKLDQNQILYIESEGNYLQIHYMEQQASKSIKTRSTIKNILPKLDTTLFQKTHRAYIVNLNHVIKATGNAQGLKLVLAHTTVNIPVARNFVAILKKQIY